MKLTMGTLDRRLRLFLAAPVLAVAGILIGPGGIVPIVMYVLAGVMVATSLAGTCPLYTEFGLPTCSASSTDTRTRSAKSVGIVNRTWARSWTLENWPPQQAA